MKEYRAYPGLMGCMLRAPTVVSCFVITFVVTVMIRSGEANTKIVLMIALLVPITLLLWRILRSMVRDNFLRLNPEGIVFRMFKLDQLNPFRSGVVEIKAPWITVREIGWIGGANGPIRIKTDQGDITFWVMFHARTNAEIMQEIQQRVPHLKIGMIDKL